MFIDSGVDGNKNWYGYDFAVNIDAPDGNMGTLSKATGGSWGWEKAGTVQMKVEGNKLMLAIKRTDLGIAENNGAPVINIQFKWADNYQKDEEGNFDIWTFYKDGDAAPYGRLNYIYSEMA